MISVLASFPGCILQLHRCSFASDINIPPGFLTLLFETRRRASQPSVACVYPFVPPQASLVWLTARIYSGMEPYPLQRALTALSTQWLTVSGPKGVKMEFHKYFHIPFFFSEGAMRQSGERGHTLDTRRGPKQPESLGSAGAS